MALLATKYFCMVLRESTFNRCVFMRMVSSSINSKDEELPVISYPQILKKAIIRRTVGRNRNNPSILKLARPGQLLISANSTSGKMYTNEFITKFKPPELTSATWRSRKSPGRFLTIHATGSIPAFREESTFDKLDLCPEILKALRLLNIQSPTNVQTKVIKRIMEGGNVMFAAETGSGKTFAYLLPLLNSLLETRNTADNPKESYSPRAIVLAPTMELCDQVMKMGTSLKLPIKFKTLKSKDIFKVSTALPKSEVLVSSPDMLIQALKQSITVDSLIPGMASLFIAWVTNETFIHEKDTRKLNLGKLEFCVLDECDTLLDDSFAAGVHNILQRFNINSGTRTPLGDSANTAQLIMCSATFPKYATKAIEDLIEESEIEVVRTGYLHRVAPHVTHKFMRVKPSEKPGELITIVKQIIDKQAIIFCNSGKTVHNVYQIFLEHGIAALKIDGEDERKHRRKGLSQFIGGQANFLIATDVLSRGVDTKQVEVVINYDVPNHVSDYLHRSGRVGRVGQQHPGSIVTLVARKWEVDVVNSIEEAARRREEITSVSANIKRHHGDRWRKKTEPLDGALQ